MSVVRRPTMKAALKSLVVCMGFCLTGLAIASPVAFAGGSSTMGEAGSLGSIPVEAQPGGGSAPAPGLPPLSLAPPFQGVPVPTAAQLSADAASRTAYEGVSRSAAVALAERTFKIESPGWTPPGSGEGAHITRYLGPNSARETLPSGQSAVVASTVPLRVEDGSGQQVPVSMTLEEHGDAFSPAHPLVPISISKDPAGGISFASGISVAPAAASAQEAPVVAGNRVVFANTAQDTDYTAEPLPGGAEVSWQLRSQRSPQDNALVFALPSGASLQPSSGIPGGAEVVMEGRTLLLIPPASAVDAAGDPLPVSYAVSGDALTTHVDLSGNVDFPVLVDPFMVGYYGTSNESHVWSGWNHYSSCGCFSYQEYYNLVQEGVNPGPASGEYGELYIYAPGTGENGGITRVDLTGVTHQALNQSYIYAEIGGSNGGNPVYSFNGYAGASGKSPLYTGEAYSSIPIAFCAQGAGGHDGGSQPLCNEENYGGSNFQLTDILGPEARTVFNYVQMIGATVTYLDNVKPNEITVSGLPHGWVKYGSSTGVTINAHDQGLGIAGVEMEIPPGHTNEQGQPFFAQSASCTGNNGFVGCPKGWTSNNINLSGLETGEYEIGAYATDAAGNKEQMRPNGMLYVDHTLPVVTLSGRLYEGRGSPFGDGRYPLSIATEDGSYVAPQSGVKQYEVFVDGKLVQATKTTCPEPQGKPGDGCYNLSGTWTMDAQEYGAGSHKIEVKATDWASNIATASFSITINEAAYEQVGPGSVNLATGDYKLGATDVSVSGGKAGLTVSRVYDSRYPTLGSSGPFGAGWTLSVPDAGVAQWQSLTQLSNGSVALYDATGTQIAFMPNGSGGFTSPVGFQTDTLTETTNPVTYKLTDAAGNATTFTQPSGGGPFVPKTVVQATGTGGLNPVSYSFTTTSKGITEPTQVLGPEPTNELCAKKLEPGCRALKFIYAEHTTATGEGSTEWGEYEGRLSEVIFTAYNTSSKEMTNTTVARYTYDKQGRLRAAWNPRISPALKTTYNYDSSGHVIGMMPPGQKEWTFTYGTISEDSNPGRLLSISRYNPRLEKTAQWTMAYHVPLYGSGAPHEMVPGTVAAWGQTSAESPADATAIFPPDEVPAQSPTSYKRATVYYLDKEDRTVNVALPGSGSSEDISTTEYDMNNNVVRTLSPANRQLALTYGTKSSEESDLLDTKSEYNTAEPATGLPAGAELIDVLGPQHTIKLANGTQVEARNHSHYTYDQNAPTGGPYYLVTTTTEGAKYGSEEADVRTTTKSYGGQEGLGWKLHAPTSTTTNPAGLDLIHIMEYSPSTGAVTATKSPGGTAVSVYPPTFSTAFGSEGSGNGQFNHPETIATDASGNVWVVDMENSRIEKLSGSGSFIAAYGSKGTGNAQFSKPSGIAINQNTGSVYVTDTANNRIEKFSSAGTFEMAVGWSVKDGKAEAETCTTECKAGIAGSGNGQFHEPTGLTVDANGNIWVTDEANNRVQELSATGSYLSQFGSAGSGNGQLNAPIAIAISEGELYVVDNGNNRVEEFSPAGSYIAQFGTTGTGQGQFTRPSGIAVNPNGGNLYVSDANNYRVEEFSPAGKFLTEVGSYGSGKGQFHSPFGMAVNAAGDLYIADVYNDRIQEWLPPGAGGAHMLYSTQFGSAGSGNGQFNSPRESAIDGHGNLWVSDYANHRIEELSATGKYIAAYGSYGTGNGQFEQPTGIDVNQSTGNVYVADCADNRVQELSSSGEFIRAFGSSGSEEGKFKCPGGVKIDSGGNVWVADSANNRIEKFSSTGTFSAAYGSAGSGNGQFKEPWGLTFSGSNLYIVDYGNNRVQELSSSGSYLGQFGSAGDGGGQFKGPETIATDSAGNLYIIDNLNHRVEEFSAAGTFLSTFGSAGTGEGQLTSPEGIAINAAGDVYVSDSSNRIEEWMPVNQAVHDTKTIYYTAKGEAEAEACRNHPEWAGLPCETTPAAQPENTTLPKLPVETITYNTWDKPETITSTSGSSTRTTTITYDSAGRTLTKHVTSSIGTSLPTTSYEYDTEKGMLIKQSTTVEGKTKTITSAYNTLGQLASYTDADENTSTYTYDIDGRPEETNDGKGKQTYSYDTTTGLPSKLVDSAAGTFTASYDAEGKMTSEGYPNGMSANTTYNQNGGRVGLEYIKTTHCTSSCTWYSESVVPSIHGQWLSQANTITSNSNTYDAAGRLVEVQETPVGKGCTTRTYAYDEETNRRSLTTRGPEAKCPTEGGTVERHTYDEANRLTDEGTSYDAFGDITTLPAADAGGHELTSSYYADGQAESTKQNGETIVYKLDPANRTREIISSGNTSAELIEHYASENDSPAWTKNTKTGTTMRYIQGVGGGLAATQTNSENPILQIANLHGDLIATASLSETATKLLTPPENATEYGVPTTNTPPRYSWLGASQRPTELPSGVIAMGARTYIPQLGRFLQTDPQPGGSANAYAYTNGDPINSSDPTGKWTQTTTSGGLTAVATGPGVNLPEGGTIAPGAIMPPPVNPQIEQEFEVMEPHFGADPYLGDGIYLAFLWSGVQFHFNKFDSKLLTIGSIGTIAAFVAAVVPPPFKWMLAGMLAALSYGTVEYINKNNCIGVTLPWGAPQYYHQEWYRSKNECG